jgi:hypothetical protein
MRGKFDADGYSERREKYDDDAWLEGMARATEAAGEEILSDDEGENAVKAAKYVIISVCVCLWFVHV